MDNFDFDKVIVYARNACYDFAEKLGYKYFLELDDDYTSFLFRFGRAKSVDLKKSCINDVFNIYLDFYEINTKIKILAFMQGGDFSDIRNGKVLRKSMNALFCSTDRRVIFNGRLNEDVNTYTRQNNIGNMCISLPFIQLCQRQTQSGNGMSETYLKYGTYTKSFYSEKYAETEQRSNMQPGEIDKITLVIWIEGDDPDCLDNLIGGEINSQVYNQLSRKAQEIRDDFANLSIIEKIVQKVKKIEEKE